MNEEWTTPPFGGANLSDWQIDAPTPDVDETENPIVGVIYCPSGDVLRVRRERRTVEFGFRGPR